MKLINKISEVTTAYLFLKKQKLNGNRFYYLLVILLTFIIIFRNGLAQEVNIPITISDGISIDTLKFGLDPAATNGIDILLNENELPPFPPAGIFDARFTGTGLSPSVPIGNGLRNDYREGNANYSGIKNHRLKFQTGSGSNIIISWWSVPAEISIRLQDIITGTLIDTTFNGTGNYLISNPLGFSSLNFTVTYNFITSVNMNSEIEFPEKIRLFQNYPNPFNPVTTIKYNLPKDGFVKLLVYSSSGKLMQEIISSYQTAGFHEVIFNSQNLPSGIYFYIMQTDKYSLTRKMIVLK